jgi:hypothetical protein
MTNVSGRRNSEPDSEVESADAGAEREDVHCGTYGQDKGGIHSAERVYRRPRAATSPIVGASTSRRTDAALKLSASSCRRADLRIAWPPNRAGMIWRMMVSKVRKSGRATASTADRIAATADQLARRSWIRGVTVDKSGKPFGEGTCSMPRVWRGRPEGPSD